MWIAKLVVLENASTEMEERILCHGPGKASDLTIDFCDVASGIFNYLKPGGRLHTDRHETESWQIEE
jgi:hypothetical protein